MPTTTNIQPWPLVRQNHPSPHPVRTLQRLLRHHGHNLVVDGAFGPKTDAAVRAFQGAHALAVDGIVGPHTWGALIVQVRKGSRGEAVKGVQEEFAFRDLSDGEAPPIAIDGIFGPITDGLVRGFQSALGLASDGIVGPLTWRALISGMLAG
jgi:peptidoglycan hydrolase-like protein with peptidoglycan-binding domain